MRESGRASGLRLTRKAGFSELCAHYLWRTNPGVDLFIMNSTRAFLGVVVVGMLISVFAAHCSAEDTNAAGANLSDTSSASAEPGIFSEWLAMVAKTQAEQPHWAPPVVPKSSRPFCLNWWTCLTWA